MSNIIVSQTVITGAPVLLAPARPGRTEVRIKIIGTGSSPITIFIGQDNTVSPATGFPIIQPPTAEDRTIILPVDGEVWGTRASAVALSVAVLEITP